MTKLFDDSPWQKDLELVENASSRKARVENFITKFARSVYPLWWLSGAGPGNYSATLTVGNWESGLPRGSFLVVSCPCALGFPVPLKLLRRFGSGFEAGNPDEGKQLSGSGGVPDTVVFDKTGTLDHWKFQVKWVKPVEERGQTLELGSLRRVTFQTIRSSPCREEDVERAWRNPGSSRRRDCGHGTMRY